MNARQFKIAQRLREITAEIDRLAQEQNRWTLQQMAYLSTRPDEAIEYRDWDALITALVQEAKALQVEFPTVADNEVFVKRFGRQAYEVYRQARSINAETKIVDVPLSKAKHGWHYVVPEPMSLMVPSMQPLNPAYYHDERKVTTFDWLATNTGQVYLAYAPEINTVFVAVEEDATQ